MSFGFPVIFFVRLKTPTIQPSLEVWEQIIVAGVPGMENTVDAEAIRNPIHARKKLYDIYDEKSFTERQCQNWFARFRPGDFDLKDAPRSGRPTEVDDDEMKAMIKGFPIGVI